MKKFKLLIEYCGTNYSGWQKQGKDTNIKTVQGTLIKAIESVFKKSKGINKFIDLQGAGRTDAGVHAICQVAHLDCETMLLQEILKIKINDELPSDINILKITNASKNFHARYNTKSRQYLYVISKRRTAFEKRFVWWIRDKLNVKKIKEAARLIEGMHDFKAFTDEYTEEKSTKCLVEKITIIEDENKIYIRIKASHFLWKMVRRITGILVEIGRGNFKKEIIHDLLNNNVSGIKTSKYTAPPSGLFLEKVEY